MTRARAFVGAVPQRVWTAVAGLALLASLAVAAVIGAGLSVWRSAVGTAAQQPPAATIEPPDSGLIVLPGGQVRRAVSPPHHVPPATPTGPIPVLVPVPVTVSPATTGPAPPATVTLVGFVPRGLPAGGENGGLANEAENHGQASAHAAHLRHEARTAHQAKRHAAKHAAKHAAGKHHAKHARPRHHVED